MDLKSSCLIIKDKASFYLKFVQQNWTKNKEMRAKIQKPYNFGQDYGHFRRDFPWFNGVWTRL
jgi:hypothetical protein